MKHIYRDKNNKLVYLDKNGDRIQAGDHLLMWDNGPIMEVARTTEGYLGTDATNPTWIKDGRAVPFEYGMYPLTQEELEVAVLTGERIVR